MHHRTDRSVLHYTQTPGQLSDSGKLDVNLLKVYKVCDVRHTNNQES